MENMGRARDGKKSAGSENLGTGEEVIKAKPPTQLAVLGPKFKRNKIEAVNKIGAEDVEIGHASTRERAVAP